jgi:hypothetical protein
MTKHPELQRLEDLGVVSTPSPSLHPQHPLIHTPPIKSSSVLGEFPPPPVDTVGGVDEDEPSYDPQDFDEPLPQDVLQGEVLVAKEESRRRHKDILRRAGDYAVPFPRAAMRGSLAALADLLVGQTEVPREFAFLSAITAVGLILAPKLKIADDGIGVNCNIYSVLLASTGGKKSTGMHKVIRTLEDAGFLTQDPHNFADAFVHDSVGSGEGLLKLFSQNRKVQGQPTTFERSRVLLAVDEFQEVLSKCRIESSSLTTKFTSLFDYTRAGNATKDDQTSLDHAHLGIIGCCTTDTWDETWAQGSERNVGLLNRLFLVSSLPREKVFSPPAPNPQEVVRLKQRISAQLSPILNYVRPTELPITPEAMLQFEAFYHGLPSEEEEATRLETIVKKLAMVLAVTNDKAVIDESVANMAILLGKYQFEVRKKLSPSRAQTASAQCENKLRAFLEGHSGEWFTVAKLLDRTRLQRVLGSGMHLQALENLHRAGLIERDIKTGKYSWKGFQ